MLVDLHEADLQRIAQELAGQTSDAADRIATQVADVGVAADVRNYVAATVQRWGTIDVLFSMLARVPYR